MKKQQYLWLFGENRGRTANNNSFYFWRYVVNSGAPVKSYFIMARTAANHAVYSRLTRKERSFILWKNSLRHAICHAHADISFVTLGFNDTLPDHIGFKSYRPAVSHHVVYLSHGTRGIKRTGHSAEYAHGALLRFVHCDPPAVAKKLVGEQGLRAFQMLDDGYHPRYQELLARQRMRAPHVGQRILWFLTWREYFGDNRETVDLLDDISALLADDRMVDFLSNDGNQLTLCLHPLMYQMCEESVGKAISEKFKGLGSVRVVLPDAEDIMDLIAEHDLLVTDYSSLGFDFHFLEKPAILYAPDVETYSRCREFLCPDEFRASALTTREQLVAAITSGVYPENFFARLAGDKHDYKGVASGKYLKALLDKMLEIQRSAVTILGYDFTGVGGTVFAMRALAEGLAEKGRKVTLCSLKRQKGDLGLPGVALKPMSNEYKASKLDKLKKMLFRWGFFRSYLRYDSSAPAIPPVAGLLMKHHLDRIHDQMVISSRESLHLFLMNAKSPFLVHRLYMFHTTAEAIDDCGRKCLELVNETGIGQAIFVTERNRVQLAEKFGLVNYRRFLVSGNGVESKRMVAREKIVPVEEKATFNVAVLMRLSSKRAADIDRLIDFAAYLRHKGNSRIMIHVFGAGDYAKTARQRTGGLRQWVTFHKATVDIAAVYRQMDAGVDFSTMQSFGMPYIESILNGRMVFCRHNEGSDEVLAGIDGVFYESNEELESRIMALPHVTLEQLQRNYDIISARYSRATVADRILA